MDRDFDFSKLLSKEYVISNGFLYDEDVFSFESYWEKGFNHYERLFYTDKANKKEPFSGLLYELYPNGDILGYSFYKDGYEDGENVDFYDNGAVSHYMYYNKNDSASLVIEWFRNGSISKITEKTDHGKHERYIEYDERGNITAQGGA